MPRIKGVPGYTDSEGNWVDQTEVPFSPEEEAAADAAEAEWLAGETRRNAIARIGALEAEITDRRIREAVLGKDNGWLAAQNERIVALRKQL